MNVEHIFRAYDIRGIFGEDLLPDVAARIGMAMGTFDQGDFIVGGDIRTSTPLLKQALILGIVSTGNNVLDIGMVPIGAAIYACWSCKKTTAYVTASHLPPEWNGIKIYGREGLSYTSEDILRVKGIFISRRFELASWKKIGKIEQENILEEFKEYLKKFAFSSGFKIVLDCGNGATSLIAPQLFKELGHDVIELNCEIDPAFSARGAEPEPEKLTELSRIVKEEKADLGIAFDGDGDRVVFVDDKGKILSAEQAAIIMLTGGVKGDVVANVECSSILDKYVESYGGRVYRVPVGHTFMVRKLVEVGAVLGVEKSSHFAVPLNPLLEEGLLTSIYFIESLAKIKRKISEVIPEIKPLKRMKIRVDESKKFKIAEKIKEKIIEKYENVDTIDGVRVNLEDGWFLIRPSNTEPLIRITAEGVNEEKTLEILKTAEKIAMEVMKEFTS